MLARPLEIVQYTQQLADNAGLGSVSGRLLIAQRPLTVVGEVGLHALQIGGQLGDLVFGVRRIGRSRPSRHVAGRDVPHSPVSGSIRRLSVTVTCSPELPSGF